jgi:hypothetical protein
VIKTCYNNGQKERLCLIIDKCRRQKLCKRAQKISAAAPLRVMLYISHCFEEPSFLFWREINCFVKETNSQLIIIPPPFPIQVAVKDVGIPVLSSPKIKD